MGDDETIVLKCPKCGHFLGELGSFLRTRHCGYEIIVNRLRPDARRGGLTRSGAEPTLTATVE